MMIRDLMTKNPALVQSSSTLADAARLMWDNDCGVVPVVGPDERVIGVLTDRDICMATWSRGAAPGEVRVEDAMTRKVVCCQASDTVEHAEAILREAQVRRLPVVDADRRLTGIVSLADIVLAAEKAAKHGTSRESTGNGVVTTLASICAQPNA